METELFNRQYIISIKELPLNEWKQFQFDAYHVYVHPNLEYVQKDGKHLSVAVLGYLFDYRNTDDTNEDIVQRAMRKLLMWKPCCKQLDLVLRTVYCAL